jgi:uncharacterized protein DUF4167
MYESNGQDVKIRGTASHIAEKYLQLARDAQSSGDPVAAENYYQHAEHYFRLIAAAQEQLRQNQPYFQQQQPGDTRGNLADDGYDDGDNEQSIAGEPFAPREPQSFYPRDPQHHQPQHYNQPQHHNQPQQHNQPQHYQPQQPQQHQPQHQPQHFQPRPQQHMPPENEGDVERLPSFITGGQPQPQPSPQSSHGQNGPHSQQGGGNGPNGYDGPDRFPLHRRRRRHHRGGGPRDYSMDQGMPGDNTGAPPSDPQSSDE